jgi:hypothetical protein
VIIDFFVAGLDVDPGRLLREIEQFATDLGRSIRLYDLDWHGGSVKRKEKSA